MGGASPGPASAAAGLSQTSASSGTNSAELLKQYEEIKRSLISLPHINLQEPDLTATKYETPLLPVKTFSTQKPALKNKGSPPAILCPVTGPLAGPLLFVYCEEQCLILFYIVVAPDLVGTYGRSCIKGQYDIYSYTPFTTVPTPRLQQSALPAADVNARKGKPGYPQSQHLHTCL